MAIRSLPSATLLLVCFLASCTASPTSNTDTSTTDIVSDASGEDTSGAIDTASDASNNTDDTAIVDTQVGEDTAVDAAKPTDTAPDSNVPVEDASPTDLSPETDTEDDVMETSDVVTPLEDTSAPDATPSDAGALDIEPSEDTALDASVDALEPGDKPCVTEQGDCFPEWYCAAAGCGGGLPGECKPMPLDCSDTPIKGVCGCDGQTYLSSCHAAASGVNVLAPGSCPINAILECNVDDPASCPDGEFCMGGCVGQGVCVEPELECSGQGSGWVCGCNGVNHSNACKAMKFGTNVKHFGYCAGSNEPAQKCGGPDQAGCPDGQHCDITGCEADLEGLCQGIWNPVTGTPGLLCLPGEPQECGCDGKTYLNKCQRILADVAKAKTGPCDGPGSCKLESGNDDCPVGMSCVGPTGICTGEGTCQTTDFVCCLIDTNKVCGCDGKTYGCKCSANKLGVPIQKLGECGQP